MKFLALKSAIDSAYEKKKSSEVSSDDTSPAKESGQHPSGGMGQVGVCETDSRYMQGEIRARLYYPWSNDRGRVVGGNILWKAVDRVAARVISKAPWWALPPIPTRETSSKPSEPRKERMSHSPGSKTINHPAQTTGTEVTDKNREQMQAEMLGKFSKLTEQTVSQSETLIERARDARAAMDDLSSTFKVSWMEFQQTSDERLKELRLTRMATDSEMRQLMAALREVRAFFLDNDYEQQIARLKDFVETCERLQALKNSGFLDTVADTILKLSS